MGYIATSLIERYDEKILKAALEDFNESKCKNLLAAETFKKLKKRLDSKYRINIMEKIGTVILLLLSLIVFILAQTSFLIKIPKEIKDSDIGFYILLTFGSLIFIIAGVSLPRLLKLKVGAIELEKSMVEPKTMEALGITKSPVYMIDTSPVHDMCI